ncbi:hypothetical protein [Robiginitalea aurantiaca]|uniref:Uncharacterized protein n=1 Tax=Robiginitalea aurantiaca TaxID=3056915 RepID=A0ABT7WDL5_9FLAO|nr:hypothetical protein [Robiginitalea aurantiaca]MDM9631009.1 hypothetical protein [Robiginitalea aurantiaca]
MQNPQDEKVIRDFLKARGSETPMFTPTGNILSIVVSLMPIRL